MPESPDPPMQNLAITALCECRSLTGCRSTCASRVVPAAQCRFKRQVPFVVALTPQQRRAMRPFCHDTEMSSGECWNEGVQPWPTMDNLVKKGLVVRVEWLDEEAGWLYGITTAGAEWMIANYDVREPMASLLRNHGLEAEA